MKAASFVFVPNERTQVHRKPARASYDRALAYSIIDEALFASVGFVLDGHPFVIPMALGRSGDRLVLHGAPASRLLKAGASGTRVCVTVTLVDGVVLARSSMHHSLNYRSVVVLGQAEEVSSLDDKREALKRVIEHVLPGRWESARPPSDRELLATRVLVLPIEEASVKVRSGGPIDDADDLSYPCWAGVIPLGVTARAPIADSEHPPRVAMPPELLTYQRPFVPATPVTVNSPRGSNLEPGPGELGSKESS